MKNVKRFCFICGNSLLGLKGRRKTCCEKHHREWKNKKWREFWKKYKFDKPYFKNCRPREDVYLKKKEKKLNTKGLEININEVNPFDPRNEGELPNLKITKRKPN